MEVIRNGETGISSRAAEDQRRGPGGREAYRAWTLSVIGQVCDVLKRMPGDGRSRWAWWSAAATSGAVPKTASGKMERTRADHMGMLATVMNCLAVADVVRAAQRGFPFGCRQRWRCGPWRSRTSLPRAIRHLEKGRVVIFGCRHRQPLFLYGYGGGAAGGGNQTPT